MLGLQHMARWGVGRSTDHRLVALVQKVVRGDSF